MEAVAVGIHWCNLWNNSWCARCFLNVALNYFYIFFKKNIFRLENVIPGNRSPVLIDLSSDGENFILFLVLRKVRRPGLGCIHGRNFRGSYDPQPHRKKKATAGWLSGIAATDFSICAGGVGGRKPPPPWEQCGGRRLHAAGAVPDQPRVQRVPAGPGFRGPRQPFGSEGHPLPWPRVVRFQGQNSSF